MTRPHLDAPAPAPPDGPGTARSGELAPGDREARAAGPDGAVLWRPELPALEPRHAWRGGAW